MNLNNTPEGVQAPLLEEGREVTTARAAMAAGKVAAELSKTEGADSKLSQMPAISISKMSPGVVKGTQRVSQGSKVVTSSHVAGPATSKEDGREVHLTTDEASTTSSAFSDYWRRGFAHALNTHWPCVQVPPPL